MKAFIVKPKHWWSYLNPFWWKKKKVLEALLEYKQADIMAEVDKKMKEWILFGESK